MKLAPKDHFDPTKYDANGNRIVKPRAVRPVNRPSVLRPEEAAAAYALDRNVRRCQNHHARAICRAYLEIFFHMRGIEWRARDYLMTKIRRGWIPRR